MEERKMKKEQIIEAFTNYEGNKDELINELTQICGWSDITSTDSYQEGKIGELFIDLYNRGHYKIEVKTEVDIFQTSGNVFIETHQWNNRKNEWVPSGINISKSDIWATPFLQNGQAEVAIVSKTKHIKELVDKIKNDKILHDIFFHEKPQTKKGSAARGYKVSINDLLEANISRLNHLKIISELKNDIYANQITIDKLIELTRK